MWQIERLVFQNAQNFILPPLPFIVKKENASADLAHLVFCQHTKINAEKTKRAKFCRYTEKY